MPKRQILNTAFALSLYPVNLAFTFVKTFSRSGLEALIDNLMPLCGEAALQTPCNISYSYLIIIIIII